MSSRTLWMACLPAVAGLAFLTASRSPEDRALAYLSREVPRWAVENRCYSCHNNGDAARALYEALRLSYPVERSALADTTAWLSEPQRWDDNKGDPRFSDKGLARLQFTAALVSASAAGQLQDRQSLRRAAALLVEYQDADGSWKTDSAGSLGSPATYGTALATAMGRLSLVWTRAAEYQDSIERAGVWLGEVEPKNVPDAAAVIIGLGAGGMLRPSFERSVSFLLEAQSQDGGWGPYPRSPPEAFDTAIALLAISKATRTDAVLSALRRGRGYLVGIQMEEGCWPETTRPPGAESYAQRLSTTGWAVQALLATQDLR